MECTETFGGKVDYDHLYLHREIKMPSMKDRKIVPKERSCPKRPRTNSNCNFALRILLYIDNLLTGNRKATMFALYTSYSTANNPA